MSKKELTKEELLDIVNKEIREIEKLNNLGDRDVFITKLTNIVDYIKSSQTEEELNKIKKEEIVQDIISHSKHKGVYI